MVRDSAVRKQSLDDEPRFANKDMDEAKEEVAAGTHPNSPPSLSAACSRPPAQSAATVLYKPPARAEAMRVWDWRKALEEEIDMNGPQHWQQIRDALVNRYCAD